MTSLTTRTRVSFLIKIAHTLRCMDQQIWDCLSGMLETFNWSPCFFWVSLMGLCHIRLSQAVRHYNLVIMIMGSFQTRTSLIEKQHKMESNIMANLLTFPLFTVYNDKQMAETMWLKYMHTVVKNVVPKTLTLELKTAIQQDAHFKSWCLQSVPLDDKIQIYLTPSSSKMSYLSQCCFLWSQLGSSISTA